LGHRADWKIQVYAPLGLDETLLMKNAVVPAFLFFLPLK